LVIHCFKIFLVAISKFPGLFNLQFLVVNVALSRKILVLVLSLKQKFRLLSSGHPKTLPFQMHESFLVQRSCPSFCRGRSIVCFLGLGGYGPSSISTTSWCIVLGRPLSFRWFQRGRRRPSWAWSTQILFLMVLLTFCCFVYVICNTKFN